MEILFLVALPCFVVVVIAGVLADLVYVRRRVPLTILLAAPLVVLAVASLQHALWADRLLRWSAALLLALATWVGAGDANPHPMRREPPPFEAVVAAGLTLGGCLMCMAWGSRFGILSAAPLVGVLGLGGFGVVATSQPDGNETRWGPALCLVLSIACAASALSVGDPAVLGAPGPVRALLSIALVFAIAVAVVHVRGHSIEPYGRADLVGVLALVALAAVTGSMD